MESSSTVRLSRYRPTNEAAAKVAANEAANEAAKSMVHLIHVSTSQVA
jgi:hypothetical protein